MNRYHRADVLRILHISAKQLGGWERAGLLTPSETYSFFDLIQVKKVRDLRAQKVRPAMIRESLQAMQKQVAGLENPLLEASANLVRGRVAFRHEGVAMDPIAGQYTMEFAPVGQVVSAKVRRMPNRTTSARRVVRQLRLGELEADEHLEIGLIDRVANRRLGHRVDRSVGRAGLPLAGDALHDRGRQRCRRL